MRDNLRHASVATTSIDLQSNEVKRDRQLDAACGYAGENLTCRMYLNGEDFREHVWLAECLMRRAAVTHVLMYADCVHMLVTRARR